MVFCFNALMIPSGIEKASAKTRAPMPSWNVVPMPCPMTSTTGVRLVKLMPRSPRRMFPMYVMNWTGIG